MLDSPLLLGCGGSRGFEHGRGRQARDSANLLLVESLTSQQRCDQSIQFPTMGAEKAQRLLMALANDRPNLGIDHTRGRLAEWPLSAKPTAGQIRILTWRKLHHAELIAHAPSSHHVSREVRGLLDVAFSTGGFGAVDNFLRRAPSQHPDDAPSQIGLGVMIAIVIRALISHAERLPSRHDTHPVHRIGTGDDQGKDGVSALVIGDALPVLPAHQERALRAEHDLLQSVQKVLLPDVVLAAAGRQQRGLVHQVPQVRSCEARRRGGHLDKTCISGKRHLARMHFEDRLTTPLVRKIHDHPAIESPRPQERAIEHVRLIGCGQHDDALPAGETVHFRQDLIQGLLLLAAAAECHRAARTADGIELVDENNRRSMLARLFEEVADPGGSYADDHLNEFRRAHGKERHPGLARYGSRQQGLSGPWCPYQQHTLWSRSAQPGVLLRFLEKIHDLDQLVLSLVDTRHVIERDSGVLRLVVATRTTLADAHEPTAQAAALLRRTAEDPDIESNDEQRRTEAEEQCRPRATARLDGLRTDLDLVIDQQLLEPWIHEGWQCRFEIDRCARLSL